MANPRTIGDPGWRPLIDTPPYPDYTSGANNVTSAITRTLALFFGSDLMTFSVTSTLTNTTRMYSRFSVAEDEVMIARIYEGSISASRTRAAYRWANGLRTGLSTTTSAREVIATAHARASSSANPDRQRVLPEHPHNALTFRAAGHRRSSQRVQLSVVLPRRPGRRSPLCQPPSW